MKTLCFLLCFLIVVCPLSKGECNEVVIAEQLLKIPYEDRRKIEDLFKYLIWDSLFAYSLFGNKPISTACSFKKKSLSRPLSKELNFSFFLPSYWKLWEKYCYLFPKKNYLFIGQENDDWFQIVLINRTACLKVIEKNFPLFQQKLGSNLVIGDIFKKITAENLFQENFHMNHALCGLLFGYEKENCLKFERIYSTNLFPKEKSESFHQEHPSSPLKLKLPFFVMFSKNNEIERLKQEYISQRDHIFDIYNHGSFLETTLQKLVD